MEKEYLRRVILLTATVNPTNLSYIGTVERRRIEYINNIRYLLDVTDLSILIIDNSGYDFRQDFPKESRLESLYFTEEDKLLKGKGYGELRLMEYGFKHSLFLKEANQIIKITGRHIIANINNILVHCKNSDSLYVDSTLDLSFARSYFFIAPPVFFTDYLYPRIEELNDSEGFYLEHLMGSAIKKWIYKKHRYREIIFPIDIIGHAGGSSTAYKRANIIRYITIFIKYFIARFKYGQ